VKAIARAIHILMNFDAACHGEPAQRAK